MAKLLHEELLTIISYNKETGDFTWLVNGKGERRAGEKAGGIFCINKKPRYWFVGVNGKKYLGHRLAWFYVTGKWPRKQIDHVDKNGGNNKWNNLREATHAENMRNSKGRSKHNCPKGVFPNGKRGFMARIVVDKKSIYLGTYKTKEEAHQIYCDKAKELHKEFASFE